jgi:hypothetical protein
MEGEGQRDTEGTFEAGPPDEDRDLERDEVLAEPRATEAGAMTAPDERFEAEPSPANEGRPADGEQPAGEPAPPPEGDVPGPADRPQPGEGEEEAPRDELAPDPPYAGVSGEEAADETSLRRQAEIEARVIRDAAVRGAQQITTEAQREARVRLRDAADHVSAVLARLEERETELSQVVGGLRSEAERLASELRLLLEGVSGKPSEAEPAPRAEPRPTGEPSGGADAPPEGGPAKVANGEPATDPLARLGRESTPAIESEVARLVALNMAFDGTPREETARYLQTAFGIDDPAEVLDDAYSRAGS